jgi:hypothetical protein
LEFPSQVLFRSIILGHDESRAELLNPSRLRSSIAAHEATQGAIGIDVEDFPWIIGLDYQGVRALPGHTLWFTVDTALTAIADFEVERHADHEH